MHGLKWPINSARIVQGIIERRVTADSTFTQGTDDITGALTGFVMYCEGLLRDVAKCWYVVILWALVISLCN